MLNQPFFQVSLPIRVYDLDRRMVTKPGFQGWKRKVDALEVKAWR
jgi:hypothetical protein